MKLLLIDVSLRQGNFPVFFSVNKIMGLIN